MEKRIGRSWRNLYHFQTLYDPFSDCFEQERLISFGHNKLKAPVCKNPKYWRKIFVNYRDCLSRYLLSQEPRLTVVYSKLTLSVTKGKCVTLGMSKNVSLRVCLLYMIFISYLRKNLDYPLIIWSEFGDVRNW